MSKPFACEAVLVCKRGFEVGEKVFAIPKIGLALPREIMVIGLFLSSANTLTRSEGILLWKNSTKMRFLRQIKGNSAECFVFVAISINKKRNCQYAYAVSEWVTAKIWSGVYR